MSYVLDDPGLIEIEPVQGCNLRCRMCHVSHKKPSVDYLDLDRVKGFSFLEGKTVLLGAAYEPLIHPDINRLIDILNKKNCKIAIITNGHNLHKKKIPALFDSDLRQITFSVDGVSKETYEAVRTGGDFQNTLSNIENFSSSFSGDDRPNFVVNFTVLRCNMHEVALAPRFWNDRNIDMLGFIAMHVRFDDPFLFENSVWEVRDDYYKYLDAAAESALNGGYNIILSSPYYSSAGAIGKWGDYIVDGRFCSTRDQSRRSKNYHRIFQYGADYGMSFQCKSPFVAARILWNGDVMLCNHYNVGSLYDNSFDEIWSGVAANQFRNGVLSDQETCKKCDYYRFCINSPKVNLENINDYYSQSMLADGVLKDTLSIPGEG